MANLYYETWNLATITVNKAETNAVRLYLIDSS